MGTTSTTTITTTTSTTAAVNTNSAGSGCQTSAGPAVGSQCVFPFSFQGVSYNGCAEWVYGGEFSGKAWCSTLVDALGEHVDGAGFWGISIQWQQTSIVLGKIGKNQSR